ncbi:MAG TPA: phage tail tip lysozyme [Verrucomicrobiae bacterium]|nr:phage tail tip lysozyme [Verrucomicrobiae bacterium]
MQSISKKTTQVSRHAVHVILYTVDIKSLRKIPYILTLLSLCILSVCNANVANAISQDDVTSILNNTPFYDPDATVGTACSASSTPVTASGSSTNPQVTQNAVTAYKFFAANGYTDAQSAGIVGNLMYESDGVNPTQVQDNDTINNGVVSHGGGYGIAQWTPPTAMEAWVKAKGGDFNALGGVGTQGDTAYGQLDYLQYDLDNGTTGAKAAVLATSSISDAATAFEEAYERAGVPALNARIDDAQAIYQDVGAVGSSDACTSSVTCGSASATGPAVLLAAAECYTNIYYWTSAIDPSDGGHYPGYAKFREDCPLAAVPTAAATSQPYSPGPCATDCSGLVSVAASQAYGQSFSWVVGNEAQMTSGGLDGPADTTDWQEIPFSEAQPGDIMTKTNPDHVEIIDAIKGNTVLGFGSHTTGEKTGLDGVTNGEPAYYSTFGSYFTTVYKYVGPNAGQ